ncbi:protein orai-2 [Biomphalaria glabrata]
MSEKAMNKIPAGMTITVEAMAVFWLMVKNLTQHSKAISRRKRSMPRPVEQTQAISTQTLISSCGDSLTA